MPQVHYELSGSIARITLEGPHKLNASPGKRCGGESALAWRAGELK